MGILARRRIAEKKKSVVKTTTQPVSNEVEKAEADTEKQPVTRQEGWEKKQGKKHGAK